MVRKKTASGGGGGGGSELFICFTARPSAASAAVTRAPSTKAQPPISPGRGGAAAAGAPPSLSASLSRRLRSSGSVKGGQSPMFPPVVTSVGGGGGGRRKGASFEAVEPSSPKVTCIGQVRVKGGKRKAKAKKAAAAALRSRSRRSMASGEVSFRRVADAGVDGAADSECLPEKNQGWVCQIPVNICESLKAFGSELNCFLPCGGTGGSGRSLCGTKKRRRAAGSWSCGQALARWLMAVQDGVEEESKGSSEAAEKDGRRDMGLVLGGWELEHRWEEKKGNERAAVQVPVPVPSPAAAEGKIEGISGEEEARVSVCIPPPNALLLMRCRSDPVRMATLATQFWGSPGASARGQVEQDQDDDDDDVDEADEKAGGCDRKEDSTADGEKTAASAADVDLDGGAAEKPEGREDDNAEDGEDEAALMNRKDFILEVEEAENEIVVAATEDAAASVDVDDSGGDDEVKVVVAARTEEKGLIRRSSSQRATTPAKAAVPPRERRHSFSVEREARRPSFSSLKEATRRASFSVDKGGRRWSFSIEHDRLVSKKPTQPQPEQPEELAGKAAGERADEDQASSETGGKDEQVQEAVAVAADKKKAEEEDDEEEDEEEVMAKTTKAGGGELPDCLLLMMYEPKLSMEVSKETWVCRTDFVNWQAYKGAGRRRRRRRRVLKAKGSGDGQDAAALKPGDIAVPLPTVRIGEPKKVKLELPPVVGTGKVSAYAPLVLKRCKSEPMRSSARLAPDACFWKDRHRPIGAAELGF